MVMDNNEQFQNLLTGLVSDDNDVRSQAEKAYESLEVRSKVSMLLSSVLNVSLAERNREMAAVLLRRLFFTKWDEFYPSLPADFQQQLKQQMLSAVDSQCSDTMKRKICEIAAEMARNLMDDDGNNLWPEFLTNLFSNANSDQVARRECALMIFSFVPGVFGNQQSRYLDVIVQMLFQNLSDQSSEKCRFLAFKATAQFISENVGFADEDSTENKQTIAAITSAFSRLLPVLIQVLQESVDKCDDTALLQSCVSLAEVAPKLLRSQLGPIMQMCLKVISDTEREDEWRQMCLELSVTIAEEASAMFRKHCLSHLQPLVENILKMMAEIEDDDDWMVSDEVSDEDNECNYIVAESSLDRLACGLGGKVVSPVVLSLSHQLLTSSDWKARHAAVSAVSTIGEGCRKQMESSLPQIIPAIVAFIKDQHPRVRHAACTCLGQMCEDFAPEIQHKFHSQLTPALIEALQDYSTPRVQAQAALALINFSGQCKKTVLAGYLDSLFTVLEQVLQNKLKELVEKGTKLVLENVITAIASVADTAEEKFRSFYDRFVPCLKYIVENANTTELRLLRGKAIECISLIGLAVGKEKFLPDASGVMDLLLKAQTGGEQLASDDPQLPYLISAWARMCTIMGKQFAVYLPLVMGPVVQMASLKPEWALLSDEDRQSLSGNADWELHNFGENQNFAVRTSVLEDKSTACAMLVCYARELGHEFAPYSQQVAELMTPLLKFYFHEGVRSSAAEIMPHLLESASAKGNEFVQSMWSYMVPELLSAANGEPTVSVVPDHLQAIAKSIETLNCPCFTEEQSTELFKLLSQLFDKHFERSKQRDAKRNDEDYDEIVEEELLNEDDEFTLILARISDVLHALFSVYRQLILPLFESLVPYLVKLSGSGRAWPEKQWALCIWDDVIEFCGPHSLQYSQHFLQPLSSAILDSQPEVVQAAVYGCGVMGMFGGSCYSQLCVQLIPQLFELVQRSDSRSESWIAPTENAISAVAKILRYNSSELNVAQLIPVWFSWLPVWHDVDETPHVYGYLCELVESNHPAVLGENNSGLPRLMAVLAEALVREALPSGDPVKDRVIALIQQIQSNTQLFSVCLTQLNEQQKNALQSSLQSASTLNNKQH